MSHTYCLLNDSFPPTIDGVANVVVNYAADLTAGGDRALVVTPAYPDVDDSAFSFPVLRYPSLNTSKLVGYRAGYPFSPEIAQTLRENHVELLHSHCPVASTFLARELREVLDAPLVFTYHTKFDVDIAKAIRGRLLQEGAIRLLAQNISACDEVWVVSRGAGENLEALGYEGEWRVMENGVDMPRGRVPQAQIDAAAAGYDLPPEVPVFLFVGRMMWYKGLRLILDALVRLRAQEIPFRMVWIGDGMDRPEVEAYTRQLGLEDACIFTGAIREREVLRAWYCRADLFLFPSTFDTNGLVVREAAACSLASVLIAGSCAAEGVTDGETGFLVEESADALAQRLSALLRAPEQMAAVGEAAAQQLYLSWEDAVGRARERYEVVIDRYRCGLYPPKRGAAESFFKMQGEFMEVLGRIDRLGDTVEQHLLEERQELRQQQQHLHQDLEQQRERLRSRLHDARDTLDAWWEKVDRYL